MAKIDLIKPVHTCNIPQIQNWAGAERIKKYEVLNKHNLTSL